MPSSNVGRAGAIIAAGTMTSRILGLVRVVVLIQAIGTLTLSANAFSTASTVPNTVYTLIATGALTAVLVPQITKAALARDGGATYINRLVTLTIVGAAAITLLAALVTAPLIMWLGTNWNDPSQVSLAISFAYWLLPQILFYSLYTVLGEVLNARSVFGPYAWSPVLNNVINIAGLLGFIWVFGGYPDSFTGVEVWNVSGEALVAGSSTLGVAVQALMLFFFWRRAGLRFRFDFRFRGIGLGTMGKVATWTFLSVLVTQIVGLVNTQVMNNSGAGEAGVAAWQNASLIFVLPHSIIVISLVTSRFTRMSEAVHSGNLRALVADVRESARLAIVSMVFFTAAMTVLAYPITRMIMFRASIETIDPVVFLLLASLVGLVAFSLLFVFNRGFFALSDTRTPFFVQLGQSALTLAVAFACTFLPSSIITITLTLAVSVLFWLQMITTFLLLRRRIGVLGGRSILMAFWQSLGAALVAGLVGSVAFGRMGGTDIDGFAMGGFFSAFVTCAVVTILMALIYGGLLLSFRNPEARAIYLRLRGRIGRA